MIVRFTSRQQYTGIIIERVIVTGITVPKAMPKIPIFLTSIIDKMRLEIASTPEIIPVNLLYGEQKVIFWKSKELKYLYLKRSNN